MTVFLTQDLLISLGEYLRIFWLFNAHKQIIFCFIFSGLFFSVTSGAQSSIKVDDDLLTVPRLSYSSNSAKRASVFGQFRFESLQYMTTLKETPSLTTSQFLSGRITAASYKRDPFSFNWAADLSAGTFFSLKQSYYSVQEIYVSTPLDDRASVSLGRKKYDWTEVDRVWALGLWQPRYAIDALRPEDQGLSGLFFDYRSEKVQVIAFGSNLFIPTVGPDVREEDGTIKADNRWYRPPSRKSGNFNLSYELDKGNLWELVSQESYGLKIRVGEEDSGPWIALAGGRKPVNDLLLQRLIHAVQVDGDANFVVNPEVVHHQVFSSDVGYKLENFKASISYFEDHPETILPPADYAIQRFSPIKIYSAQVDWNVKEFFSRPLQVQMAYMKSYGDDLYDIESNGAESDITLFTYRYRFSNAAMARVLGPLTSIYARPLITKFGYTYDFDQKGSILGMEFQYQWNRTWSYLAGVDILGADDSNSTSEGFINTYRANDRAYAGVSYVF